MRARAQAHAHPPSAEPGVASSHARTPSDCVHVYISSIHTRAGYVGVCACRVYAAAPLSFSRREGDVSALPLKRTIRTRVCYLYTPRERKLCLCRSDVGKKGTEGGGRG